MEYFQHIISIINNILIGIFISAICITNLISFYQKGWSKNHERFY